MMRKQCIGVRGCPSYQDTACPSCIDIPEPDEALPMQVGETCRLRYARPEDAYQILLDIRDEDAAEWEASVEGGVFWLANSILQSDECIVLADLASDIPLVIFGVIRREGHPADIWMVASKFGPERATWAWYLCANWVKAFWKRWPEVHCWSDNRNPLHHRWLEWVGFQRGPSRPWGREQRPFTYFHRREA